MKKNPLVLTVYSRMYQAANDDGMSEAACSTKNVYDRNERRTNSGWDPLEVWRTRIRPTLKRDHADS
ncbi:MAG: hypothetical protein WBE92_11440 [Steroidobacteraceae bacterium]